MEQSKFRSKQLAAAQQRIITELVGEANGEEEKALRTGQP